MNEKPGDETSTSNNSKRRIKQKILEKMPDFLIGVGLLIKGYDKAEHFGDHPLQVTFFFLAGLLVIAGTMFQRKIEKRFRKFTALYHLLEGAAFIVAGSIMLENKKSKIPYFLFLAGAGYLAIGLAKLIENEQNREKVRARLRLILSISFLTAAAAAIAVNLVFFHDIWMHFTAIVLVISAIGIQVFPRLFERKKARKASVTD